MDDSFLKADGEETEDDELAATTILSLWDESSQLGIAFALVSKTAEWKYVLATMKQFIDSLGHQRYRLRTDNKPTIVKLAVKLCKNRHGGVHETAPR